VKPRKDDTQPPVSKHAEQQQSERPNSPNIITTYGPNSPVTTGPNSPITINPEQGWQKLTDQDLANNVALLSPFAGQTVKIWIPNATDNQYALASQLKVVLERSNWKILDLQNIMAVGGGPRYGVIIRANSASPALDAIATATIRLLGKENVRAGLSLPPYSPLDGDYIHIDIWPKAPKPD
jgi:hypothetical protein